MINPVRYWVPDPPGWSCLLLPGAVIVSGGHHNKFMHLRPWDVSLTIFDQFLFHQGQIQFLREGAEIYSSRVDSWHFFAPWADHSIKGGQKTMLYRFGVCPNCPSREFFSFIRGSNILFHQGHIQRGAIPLLLF